MPIVTNKINSHPRFTQHLIKINALASNPLVIIDGGASGGFEKQWEFFKNQIIRIGFEPQLREFKKLQRANRDIRNVYYPFGLHKNTGYQELYVTRHKASSGFYEPDTPFLKRIPDITNFVIDKKIKVKTVDLDSFLKKHSFPLIDFIKLDTDGSEFDILEGSRNTIKNSVI